MSSPAEKNTTQNKTPKKDQGSLAGKKITLEGASKEGSKTRKEETSPAGKTSTQEEASPGEKETSKKRREGKSSGFESSVSKSQINFNVLKSSDEFKEWFWTESNAKDIILAVNDYSFRKKQFEGSFVRYEKSPAHIYGVVINKGDQNNPFWENINKLGLKLVKVGFTQNETIKGTGNRMEVVMDQLKKDGRFTTSIIFCLIIDFTTAHNLREEEQDIRRKVGIELDKELAKWLNLPIPTGWVITTQKNIDFLKRRIEEKKKQRAKDRKMYTTKDVEPCDRQSIEELVKKIDAHEIGVKDDKVVLLSRKEPCPSTPEKVPGKLEPLHQSKEP